MSTRELRDHVALVTGAGRGIGRAIALELARRGADVGLLARHERELDEVAAACREHGVRALALPVDVTDDAAVDDTLARLQAELGAPEIVVVNHGTYAQGTALAVERTTWDRVLDVNLRGAMHLTQRVLPGIVAADAARRRALVFVSSIAARHHYAGAAAYCASKAGLSAFADVVFEEVRDRGVKVVQILPGYVNTAMMVDCADNVDSAKMVQPEDVADSVAWAISSPSTCCPVEIVLRPQLSPYQR